jgi:hypothetical protein
MPTTTAVASIEFAHKNAYLPSWCATEAILRRRGKMDWKEYLDDEVAKMRQNRLRNSDQLSLGKLIEKLTPFVANYPDAPVMFDFCGFYPTEFASWRGDYAELALNYERHQEPLSASRFLNLCQRTIGNTFVGYKGGDFKMSADTPVWVSAYGESDHTAVVDVTHDGSYCVILVTGYREY